MNGSGKKLWGIDPESLKGKLPPFLADVPEIREDFADYLGEAQAFDGAVGQLVAHLEAIGELDNTLIVVSGDHGPPGFPHGKCNLYDFGTKVALIMRLGKRVQMRVVDDLVSLTDLAPTFLEAADVDVPDRMTGRSLMKVLQVENQELQPKRDAVYIGRERHVDSARADYAPYPQRAIRTDNYLYIINFHPERYPLGDPFRLDVGDPPTPIELANTTFVTLADEDAGPAKAWLVSHRKDPAWGWMFDMAYGKRPREELYDLKTDPHQMKNVAQDADYHAIRADLQQKLLGELERTGDPRVIANGEYFETPPLAGPANAR